MKTYLVETEDYGTVGCSVSVDDYMSLSFDCVKSVKEVKRDPYEEVWEFFKLIYNSEVDGGLSLSDTIECFGGDWPNIVNKYTYEEAKKLYDAWKEKKDKEFNVGDEVHYKDGNSLFVVTRIYSDAEAIDCVKLKNGMTLSFQISEVKKTGKHYPEIAKLFSK